jgi:hypothetical protein
VQHKHTSAFSRPRQWLATGLLFFSLASALPAQEKPDNAGKETKPEAGKANTADKPASGNLSAEQIAELVIYFHGSRPVLQQIRRTGIERGRITRTAPDGRAEEINYDLRFSRGENNEKDRVRLDQQMPTIEYSLVYDKGNVFGLLKGAVFKPRQDATDDMLSDARHGIEALLRYKENGSALTLVGKEKAQNVEYHVIELTDKEQRRTRYFVSTKFFRVSWAEYEEATASGSKSSYKRRYYDYRSAQGTLVPYRSVLYRDGKQISETQVLTVTYGGKVDDAIFQNPEQAAER